MYNGSTTWSYAYNTDGLRTKRTNGSTAYERIYNGGQLSKITVAMPMMPRQKSTMYPAVITFGFGVARNLVD